MHQPSRRWVSAFILTVSICQPQRALAQSADTVLEWNGILVATLGTPGAVPPTVFFTRPLALMHVAVFDAINSFDRVYTPYIDFVDVPAGASRRPPMTPWLGCSRARQPSTPRPSRHS